MKVVAVGNKEMLIGFMLAGVKERLETEDPDEALKFLHEIAEKETACLAVVIFDIYREIEEELSEIQERKPSFIFYEFSGGGFKWRKKR
jgi:vacuolar-type H+-ATPase subunit F/Vma7